MTERLVDFLERHEDMAPEAANLETWALVRTVTKFLTAKGLVSTEEDEWKLYLMFEE